MIDHRPHLDPRLDAMGLLATAFFGLNARFTTQLAEHELSPMELTVLLRLARAEDHQLRMSDLAARAHLTTSGVTRVVDRMERDGLVTRIACPTDRRSLYTKITEDGLERLNKALPGHLEVIDAWFTGRLTPDQLAGLTKALCVVRQALEETPR